MTKEMKLYMIILQFIHVTGQVVVEYVVEIVVIHVKIVEEDADQDVLLDALVVVDALVADQDVVQDVLVLVQDVKVAQDAEAVIQHVLLHVKQPVRDYVQEPVLKLVYQVALKQLNFIPVYLDYQKEVIINIFLLMVLLKR